MRTQNEHRPGMWKVVLHVAGVLHVDTAYYRYLEEIVRRNRSGDVNTVPSYNGPVKLQLDGRSSSESGAVACPMPTDIDLWIHLAGGNYWQNHVLRDPEGDSSEVLANLVPEDPTVLEGEDRLIQPPRPGTKGKGQSQMKGDASPFI